MDHFISRLFLVRCFRQNKILFFGCLVFIAMVVYGHKTRCEITPAIDFAMYSAATDTRTDSFYSIYTDGCLLDLHHSIDEPRRLMIFSTLTAWRRGILSGYQDPALPAISAVAAHHPFMNPLAAKAYNKADSYKNYLPWLLTYIRHAVDPNIRNIEIHCTYIHYNAENLPMTDSVKYLYSFGQTQHQ